MYYILTIGYCIHHTGALVPLCSKDKGWVRIYSVRPYGLLFVSNCQYLLHNSAHCTTVLVAQMCLRPLLQLTGLFGDYIRIVWTQEKLHAHGKVAPPYSTRCVLIKTYICHLSELRQCFWSNCLYSAKHIMMLVRFMGLPTVWMKAVLPPLRRFMLFPSSGWKCVR